MKAMKAKKSMKKAMKSTKRRKAAKKVSVIAKGKRARASVWNGNKSKTASGLSKGNLMKNKRGKIVTKKSHARGVKNGMRIAKWQKAFKAARKALNIKGFCPCGGKSAKGK